MKCTTAAMKFTTAAAALAAMLLQVGPALSQIDPSDLDAPGLKRGIQQLNASGQVGAITLLERGDSTTVDLTMHGVPSGKVEDAAIVRLRDCTAARTAVQAYPLAPLRDGRSSTLIAAPIAKLASGNYGVVIRSQVKPQNLFACGQLYRT